MLLLVLQLALSGTQALQQHVQPLTLQTLTRRPIEETPAVRLGCLEQVRHSQRMSLKRHDWPANDHTVQIRHTKAEVQPESVYMAVTNSSSSIPPSYPDSSHTFEGVTPADYIPTRKLTG